MKSLSRLSLVILVIGTFFNSRSALAENTDPVLESLRARLLEQQIETDYKNPKEPVIEKDRAILGKRNAPILIVAYSDFQCPYCKRGAETLETVLQKYGKKVVYVFKNFPLSFHPFAMAAAQRFQAIAYQSAKKAYEYHDLVFKNQDQLDARGEVFLDEIAKRVGANMTKMKKEMGSERLKTQIDADMAEAQKFEITGTPGFVVAGVLLKGAYPAEMFQTIIDRRLADAAARTISSK